MKKKVLFMVICFSLVGCATSPVQNSVRKPLPQERQLAYVNPTEINNAKIVVTRDSGMTGSGCYYGLWVDGVLAGRFSTKETATFYLPSGERVLRAGRDPQGKGLCAVDGNNWTQTETTVDKNSVKTYRLSLDMNGRPSIFREN